MTKSAKYIYDHLNEIVVISAIPVYLVYKTLFNTNTLKHVNELSIPITVCQWAIIVCQWHVDAVSFSIFLSQTPQYYGCFCRWII